MVIDIRRVVGRPMSPQERSASLDRCTAHVKNAGKVTDVDGDVLRLMLFPLGASNAPPPSASPSAEKSVLPATSTPVGAPLPNTADASSPSKDKENVSVVAAAKKKKKGRCAEDSCNRKLGLTGFACKCGQLYCGAHRYRCERLA